MDKEITKQEFKELFFRYGVLPKDGGWTEDFWNQIYENEISARYFFIEPTSPDQNRMFIATGGISGQATHRISLKTSDEEEAGFWDLGD